MVMARNITTYNRLARIIKKGSYDKEILLLDLGDYLRIGVLTQKEYDDLLILIEENPVARAVSYSASFDEEGRFKTDNIYKLSKKVIVNKYYEKEIIEQVISDFRICEDLGRNEFLELIDLIDETYNPVIEVPEEEIPEDNTEA